MVKYCNDDCFNHMEKYGDHSIDFIYVDPPYGIRYKKWDTFSSKEKFIEFTIKWAELFTRKLKPTGSMIVFMAKENLFINKNKNVTKGVINILEDYGTVHIDNLCTWKRQKGRGSKKKLKSLREEVIHFTKHPKDYTWNFVQMKREVIAPYVKDGRPRGWYLDEETGMRVRWTGLGDVWCYSSPQWNGLLDKQRHPAQKPFLLVERIILLHTNPKDLVVDPFMGSGSCSLVCKYHDRHYVGIEKDKKTYRDTVDFCKNNYEKIKTEFEKSIHRIGE